jgi:hypothetical protein
MNILGIVTGSLFEDLNIRFSSWFILVALLGFSIAWWKYPAKKNVANKLEKSRQYVFQKNCDVVLVGSTFLMFIYFGNQKISSYSTSVFSDSAIKSVSLPKDSTKTYKPVEEFKKSLYDKAGHPLKWKESKKLLKQQIRAIKKDKTISVGGKAGLIVLCILIAIILAYGVAALSCSLSCSGSEGAAVAVAVLGLLGIILLAYFAIHSITRKAKREREKVIEEHNPPTRY